MDKYITSLSRDSTAGGRKGGKGGRRKLKFLALPPVPFLPFLSLALVFSLTPARGLLVNAGWKRFEHGLGAKR